MASDSERVTEKLRAAALILSGESLGDCEEETILDAVRQGKVTRAQVYAAIEALGYRWQRSTWPWHDWRWVLQVPAWLEKIRKGQR